MERTLVRHHKIDLVTAKLQMTLEQPNKKYENQEKPQNIIESNSIPM